MQSFARLFCRTLLVASSISLPVKVIAAEPPSVSITDFGAVPDTATLNTDKIQSAIDSLASKDGGTLIIPKGTFLTGAIFLKPGVNLHLDEGAILKGSPDTNDYPKRLTRIEGHSQEWLPALINANKCDHLRITGPGTLDGNGATYWQAFFTRRKANGKTTNLDVPRPRLVFIQDCRDIQISNITFKDSGFWNLHLYRCTEALVENAKFQVPDGVRCPSTDGTDIDSSKNVTIRNCTYRVNDDCICLKGSKGPFAMDDKDSPPVEHIHVTDCIFERGGGVLTVGSEATVVRDVLVENCKSVGSVNIVRLKLRPDTPQDYEDIHYRNITLDGAGTIINISPWKQYFDLKGQSPPHSIVHDVTLSNITGQYGSFGTIEGNTDQTAISDIKLQNINVKLKNDKLKVANVQNLSLENVTINDEPYSQK